MSAQLVPMDTNWSQWMLDETEESLTMYASSVVNNNDLNSFNNMVLYDNSFKKINLDGLNSGVPTRTTPTITPTTLRIFDEMLLQQCDLEGHENEAGFVPPILPPITSSYTQANGSVEVSVVDSAAWQGGSTTVVAPELGANSTTSSLNTSSVEQCSTPPHSTPSSRCDTPPHHPTIQPKRNVGGRRPIKEKGISLEEEKRREVRRERNKQAAARCRKRRMDHTNELLVETEGLAQKKVLLSEEVAQLRAEVQQLELLLESHQMSCRMSRVSPDTGVDENAPNPSFLEQEKVTVGGVTISIKSEPGTQVHPECGPVNNTNNKRVALGNNNRPRPNSLPVSSSPYLNHASSVSKHQSESRTGGPAPLISDIAGIPISTPSTGIVFNFESLMEGGSGMTPLANPIVPSCSSQQRGDCATSPDAVNSKRMLSL